MAPTTNTASPRFLDALTYAVQLHAGDARKGTPAPYVVHLFGACSLVLLDGGNEDEAIAALLHDALEDHPEETSPAIIAERFGPTVLALVQGCTDTPPGFDGGPKPDWKTRKLAYLERLQHEGPSQHRVALADKVDNARAMVTDLRRLGDALWTRFRVGKAEQLWYYRALVGAFAAGGASGDLFDELARTVSELECLAGSTLG